MPITRVTNRIRPKNHKNRAKEVKRASEQARWLATGSSASHAELLDLDKYVAEQEAAKAANKAVTAEKPEEVQES